MSENVRKCPNGKDCFNGAAAQVAPGPGVDGRASRPAARGPDIAKWDLQRRPLPPGPLLKTSHNFPFRPNARTVCHARRAKRSGSTSSPRAENDEGRGELPRRARVWLPLLSVARANDSPYCSSDSTL